MSDHQTTVQTTVEDATGAVHDAADAVQRLTDDTRRLVAAEVRAARAEAWEKARELWPAAARIGGAGLLAVYATAGGFGLADRVLGKLFGRTLAAMLLTAGCGFGAAYLGVTGWRQVRESDPPWPSDTLREARQAGTAAAARS